MDQYFRTPASALSIRAGSSVRNSGGVVIQVEEVFQHPDFDYWEIDYDITVLRLASNLTFSTAIASIALPVANQELPEGLLAVVTGWGTTSEGSSSLPLQLQYVQVPIVSLATCRAAYGTSAVTDRMLCAGYTEGGRDACQVDSTPLLTIKIFIENLFKLHRF